MNPALESLPSSSQTLPTLLENHLLEAVATCLVVGGALELIDRLTKDNFLLHFTWRATQTIVAVVLILFLFKYLTGILSALSSSIQ